MKDYQSINRKASATFVDFVIAEACRIVHLAESTQHFTRFPKTEIDCGDYFRNQISELIKQVYNESIPLPVSLKLEQMLNDVGYYVTCCEFPGVSHRWQKINPRLEYFDCAYDLYEDPEIRPLTFNDRQKLRVFVTDARLTKRNEYLARVRQEFEKAGVEFSLEKAFYKEVNDTFDLIISEMRDRINSLLKSIFKSNFNEVQEKLSCMTIEEFKSCCPTDDLIDPRTGKKAFDDSLTTLERYNHYRKLAREIGYDADSSYEAMVIAQLVFPFASREKGWYIAEQEGVIIRNGKEININPFGLKYELRNDKYDFTLRGDTMNSVATALKACSHLINGNAELEQLRDEFIKMYHTFGNFMLLPYRNGVSVNGSRGIGTSHDYFDIFLTAVRKRSLDSILNEASSHLMHEFINECIITNGSDDETSFFLESLLLCYAEISDDVRCQFEFWKGHDLDNIYPETHDQVKAFFTNATKMIGIRSEYIYKRLKGELH